MYSMEIVAKIKYFFDIVLELDNTAVQYGWNKRYCKNDPETSVLIRALHIIEAYLHCRIYVRHVKECQQTWQN